MESTEFAKTINGYRNVLMVTICTSTILLIGLGYLYLTETKKHEDKIYVIADNGRFIANQTTSDILYDFDMKNHLKVFCQNMFAYDQYNYNTNIETGLNLIDVLGGKRIYNDIKTSGVYENLKKYNARTKINIDSIKIDMTARPVGAIVYLTQTVIYSDQSAKLPIAAKMSLVSANRSEKNPFGMLITNFDYIPYNIGVNDLSDGETATEKNNGTTDIK